MAFRRSGVKTLGADGKADGGGTADGRRSPHPELFDGFIDGFRGFQTEPFLFTGEQSLVDNIQNTFF